MQFDTLEFLIFLPIFFAIYWSLKEKLRLQNLFVIVGSYVFYGWADWRYLFLIIGYSAWSYCSGLLLGRTQNRLYRKAILWSTILAEVGVLGLYKYFDFFVNNFNRLFAAFGIHLDWVTLHLVLPIGISFYTFQALSYTIDVYRGKIEPTKDAISFAAFLCFFPQLVAGPIERATSLLPQFQRKRVFTYGDGVVGMKRILWGLFKKMVIADNCGVAVDQIFMNYASLDSFNLLLGAIFFTFQIYGDFSGYSDIAIGCGRLLGIRLMENFRMPYFSRNVKEFWQRWHISLNRWLLDYIYIPLGGSRRGFVRMLLNIMIVFAISGVWHGAKWSYISWGVYCGLMLVAYVVLSKIIPRLATWLSVSITFIVSMLGWVFFRSDCLRYALEYIHRMCSFIPFNGYEYDDTITVVVLLICFVVAEFCSRNKDHVLQFSDTGIWKYNMVRWSILWLLVMSIAIFRGDVKEFIYFQF
jgi:D-alanyl-lipoteichoic acid acyltransferase DltB (MBOAT superfamily)